MRFFILLLCFLPFKIYAQFLDGVPQDDFQSNMREKKSIETMQKEFEAKRLEIKKKFLEIEAEKTKNLRYGDINNK